MILKINNMLDKELYKEQLQKLPVKVREVIEERLQGLVEAFGNPYLESQFGGVAIYILTDEVADRRSIVEKILQFYNINSTDELYEYSEIIETGNAEVNYSETLFLAANGELSVLLFCAFE